MENSNDKISMDPDELRGHVEDLLKQMLPLVRKHVEKTKGKYGPNERIVIFLNLATNLIAHMVGPMTMDERAALDISDELRGMLLETLLKDLDTRRKEGRDFQSSMLGALERVAERFGLKVAGSDPDCPCESCTAVRTMKEKMI